MEPPWRTDVVFVHNTLPKRFFATPLQCTIGSLYDLTYCFVALLNSTTLTLPPSDSCSDTRTLFPMDPRHLCARNRCNSTHLSLMLYSQSQRGYTPSNHLSQEGKKNEVLRMPPFWHYGQILCCSPDLPFSSCFPMPAEVSYMSIVFTGAERIVTSSRLFFMPLPHVELFFCNQLSALKS